MSYDPGRMRAAVLQMVQRSKPNAFLTFSFGHPHRRTRYAVGRHPGWHPTPAHAVHARVEQFLDRLRFETDGAPVPFGSAFGFLESASLNPHLHIVAPLDADQFDWLHARGDAVWRKLSNNGQLNIQKTRNPVKVLSYCTKRFTNQIACENMFIHSWPKV